MEEITSSDIDHLSDIDSTHSQNIIKFIVLCHLKACEKFLHQPFDFGRKHVWRNSLLHFSRWLVGVYHRDEQNIFEANSNITFDNIAVIHYFNASGNQKLNQTHYSNNKFGWIPIETLMWRESTRRELSKIGYVNLNGSLLLQKDTTIFHNNGSDHLESFIYPNTEFGFNQRKFLMGTLPWAPFVELDEERNQYSGLTIEVIKELSHILNFTYELKAPPDGKWGADKGNKSWNGLLGEIQRRDIDLVAAPLAINSYREQVMDFTHPYYYEHSGIVIKRPPHEHWRKLLNPLTVTVYLYIGISLPVITLFLFLFEKYNPFYRNIAGRKIVRGLHHFSDSFWYMYGALLCQGGEHIAVSSAGRTLLSCWWIFCIVIVATYSGNFVAFLTFPKEKLPFKDIEGLVEQSTYKWGTAGETIYETIFKNSELPERKKLWNGMIGFNQTDPSVFSSDPAEQIRKVEGGNYAYVADKTYIELAISHKCDLSLSPSDIQPILYAFPLPETSPFVKTFSDAIISIVDNGLIQMWKMKTWPKPGPCQQLIGTEAKTIFLIDFQIAFYIVIAGVVLGCLSLLYEHIKLKCGKCMEKRQRKKKENNTNGFRKSTELTDVFYSNSLYDDDDDSPMKLAIRRQVGSSVSKTRKHNINEISVIGVCDDISEK
ncbi:GRIK3 [Mytilus coruscus]|uniref:GRIK3 n=1 Tax=Mytilus coruscus TaxID=42192 RepID=A0A6J8BW46_MYTCO|nr:GRIK3 [Mytilus coruscus]